MGCSFSLLLLLVAADSNDYKIGREFFYTQQQNNDRSNDEASSRHIIGVEK